MEAKDRDIEGGMGGTFTGAGTEPGRFQICLINKVVLCVCIKPRCRSEQVLMHLLVSFIERRDTPDPR